MDRDEYFLMKTAALFLVPPYGPEKGADMAEYMEKALDGTLLAGACDYLERVSEICDNAPFILNEVKGAKSEPLVLRNPFMPLRKVRLRPIEKSRVENFYLKLNEKLRKLRRDVVLQYIALHTIMEPLWVSMDLPIYPFRPDFPVYSRFDYLYACSSYVNQHLGGSRHVIEIKGVQNFIRNSRKLADLWSSSYMVSLFSWYAVQELVLKLGPDILISPPSRFNPFYYHSFLRLLDPGLRGEFAKLISSGTNYRIDEYGYPPYAVIPEKAILLLPNMDLVNDILPVRDLKSYVEGRKKELWRFIVEAVLNPSDQSNEVLQFLSKLFQKGINNSSVRIDNKIEKVKNTPPLDVRVDPDGSMIKYHFAADLGVLSVPIDGSEGYPEGSPRGYDYCRICNELPAFIRMPKEENEYKQMLNKLFDENSPISYALASTIIADGEYLCPWCLVKRAFPYILRDVLDRVKLLTDEEKGDFGKIPSTADFASIETYEYIIENYGKYAEQIEEIVRKTGDVKPIRNRWGRKAILYTKEDSVRNRFLTLDPEKVFYERPPELPDKENIPAPKLYYALVMADGDSGGRLLEGRIWEEPMAVKLRTWWMEAAGRELDRGIRDLLFEQALSSSLMRAAIEEGERISANGGFVIYSGGDDLLFASTVDDALGLVVESRRRFSGADPPIGFMCVRDSHYPRPTIMGRSYSIAVAHYKHPLGLVLEELRDALKEAKERPWFFVENVPLWKDTLVVSYLSRGRKTTTRIPFSPHRPIYLHVGDLASIVEVLKRVLEEIGKGRLPAALRSFRMSYPGVPPEIQVRLIKHFIERRERPAPEGSRVLDELVRILDAHSAVRDREGNSLGYSVLTALNIFMSGRRGVWQWRE